MRFAQSSRLKRATKKLTNGHGCMGGGGEGDAVVWNQEQHSLPGERGYAWCFGTGVDHEKRAEVTSSNSDQRHSSD